MEPGLLKNLLIIAYAIAVGFTASGITATIYRMVAKKPQTLSERFGYYAVMIFAGPNVLIQNATASLRKKDCSKGAYWLAAAVTTYWSFMLGLLILSLSLSLQ